MEIKLKGYMKERVDKIIVNWALPARESNPYIMEMFYNRETDLTENHPLPWSGEFIGKHLTSLSYLYKLTSDSRLLDEGNQIVKEIYDFSIISQDGYLGAFNKEFRFNKNYIHDATYSACWDCWNHYHILFGLNKWNETAVNNLAELIILRTLDYLYDFFIKNHYDFDNCGTFEINYAITHIYTILIKKYNREKDKKVLDYIDSFINSEKGGKLLEKFINNIPQYQLEEKYRRWETLHTFEHYYELFKLTKNDKYKTAFENIYNGITDNDVHNTGGYSSIESACGNEFKFGAIENCCTVAYTALSIDYYNMTHKLCAVDTLERTFYNAVLGAMHTSGRWAAYNAPMKGFHCAAESEIVFQARPASPELNCCSVNAPRAIGMLSEWMCDVDGNCVYLNYFGEAEYCFNIENKPVKIAVNSNYPIENQIDILVDTSAKFILYIRIPGFSKNTSIKINGKKGKAISGEYYKTEINSSIKIELELDLQIRIYIGHRDCEGMVSLFYGNILLAYDMRYNKAHFDNPPAIDLNNLKYKKVTFNRNLKPQIFFEFEDIKGEKLLLCDYQSAGKAGTGFNTWLYYKK